MIPTKTHHLSPRALEIFQAVTAAMQPAEEMGGPDDYDELMHAIIDEATERQCAYGYANARTITEWQALGLAHEALAILNATQDDSFAPTNAVRALPCYNELTPADRAAINAKLDSLT